MARVFSGTIEDVSATPSKDLQCKAADVPNLPTDVAPGSSCLVLDTGDVYIFSAVDSAWHKL